ncbi:MFS transporter [Phenylobacterium sp.]|uniref:MFS transporter n=1 Tax=Phenylobacterium sp. TaxID=1871053 RepID=UPI003983328A
MTTIDPASAPQDAEELKPPAAVKVLYGIGHMHEGGFNVAIGFAFFYYTAVLGLSGSLVGAALFIGLCFDAGVDPFIGSWSDNIRSKWGRRVPLMLVGAPVMALALAGLFSPPPGLAEPLLFAWLLAMAITLRVAMSLFHVPYVALGAELATGYAERSSVVAYRTVASVLTAVVVTALAYSVFFAGEGGLQRPERYPGFGMATGVLIFIGMVVCSLGVRRYAATLPHGVQATRPLLRRLPGEVAEIFRNRSFRILFCSAVVVYTAIGLHTTLNTHVNVFVWKLQPSMIQTLAYIYLAGLMAGVPIAPMLSRRMEKKVVVVIGMSMVIVVWALPPILRALGLFTATGAEAVPLLAIAMAFAGMGSGFAAIAYPSMMADAVDEHEHLFAHRREGLYFAGLGFAFKGSVGIGLLLAGLVLDLLQFPKEAGRQVGAVLPEDLLIRLVLTAGVGSAILAAISMAMMLPYAISRRRHDEISSGLRARRLEAAETAAAAAVR